MILELILPPMDLNYGIFPTPFIPPLSMNSTSINQDHINCPIEPMKDSMIDPPSSQHISSKSKHNFSSKKYHKKIHAQAISFNVVIKFILPSLDTTMHDVLDEVVTNNDVNLHDSNDSICILDPILINLDVEYALDDTDDVNDEYETIDIDVDLPYMLSSQLTLTPSIELCDSQEDPCLEQAIINIMMDIVPIMSYPPSLNDIQQDGEIRRHAWLASLSW